MNRSDLAYDRYTTNGNDEWLLRIGPADAPALLVLPPLFEELNRLRATIVGTMRLLAERGWRCLLPDLPGTGESVRALETLTWADWRGAAADCAPSDLRATIAFRGGALLDDAIAVGCAWRLSPVSGASLVRDLDRTALTDDSATGGYSPSEALRAGLKAAQPAVRPRLRTLRLSTDPAAADCRIEAAPLWRRAEPQSSSQLKDILASDIDNWARACAAC